MDYKTSIDRSPCTEQILSEDYIDFITDYLLLPQYQIPKPDFCYTPVDDQYGIVSMNRRDVGDIMPDVVGYRMLPKVYALTQAENQFTDDRIDLEDGSRNFNTIPLFENENRGFDAAPLLETGSYQMTLPPLSLTGKNVLIGFIDTGIDYTLPIFQDEYGSSRIEGIWDQEIQTGTPPEGFFYGSYYDRTKIEEALLSENPFFVVPSTDENGHGTAVASVAAGSRTASGESGCAYDAQIMMVKLKKAKRYLREYYFVPDGEECYSETDIMEAVAFLEKQSVVTKRPVIIVLGVGGNLGDHKGDDPLSAYLNKIARKRNRIVMVSTGNEGAASRHFHGVLPQTAELRVGDNVPGFCMEIWGNISEVYSVSVVSPGGEYISPILPSHGLARTFSFVYDRTQIELQMAAVDPTSGSEVAYLRFKNPSPGIWNIRVQSIDNYNADVETDIHMWLPMRQITPSEVYFLKPDPNTTITEPGFATEVFTVGAYQSDGKRLDIRSGRGYSTTGMVKPDLVAPGVSIQTAVGVYTGASIAVAFAAGCVAQFLQWAVTEGNAPLIESKEVKSYFLRGAMRDDVNRYPDTRWGYGRLSLTGLFDVLTRS